MGKAEKGFHILAYEKAMQLIAQLICKQELKRGDKLPPERMLAQMFGISRSTVREALQVIAANGIVEIKQGSGIYITDPERIPALISASGADDDVRKRLNDLLELRIMIEKYGFRKVAEQITENEINQLYRYEAETFESILETIHPESPFGVSSTALERKILQFQPNRALIEEHDRVCTEWRRLLDELNAVAQPPIDRHSDHLNILKAISERNASKIGRAVEYHLKRAVSKVNEDDSQR